MPKKAKRAERLVEAMRKLHRVEELKKIELQRQMSELRRNEEDILARLNLDEALEAMMMQTSARYLRTLAREAEKVSHSQERQDARLLDQAGKLKRAEKLRDKLAERRARVENEKHLNEVIERYGGKGGTSLP
jgi:hypothetical protein